MVVKAFRFLDLVSGAQESHVLTRVTPRKVRLRENSQAATGIASSSSMEIGNADGRRRCGQGGGKMLLQSSMLLSWASTPHRHTYASTLPLRPPRKLD